MSLSFPAFFFSSRSFCTVCTVQHNNASVNFKDQKRRSIPWGRSHLQTDYFETPILHARWIFHLRKLKFSTQNVQWVAHLFELPQHPRKTQSSHARHLSSMTISKSGLPGFFLYSFLSLLDKVIVKSLRSTSTSEEISV